MQARDTSFRQELEAAVEAQRRDAAAEEAARAAEHARAAVFVAHDAESLARYISDAADDDAVAAIAAFSGDVNVRCAGGGPLLAAVQAGKVAAVTALARRGADAVASSSAGGSALFEAARLDNGSLRALLAAVPRIDVNAAAGGGDRRTPLHVAAAAGVVSSVRLLIGVGARTDAKAGGGLLGGKTAEQMARGEGHAAVATLIDKAVRCDCAHCPVL